MRRTFFLSALIFLGFGVYNLATQRYHGAIFNFILVGFYACQIHLVEKRHAQETNAQETNAQETLPYNVMVQRLWFPSQKDSDPRFYREGL